MDRYNADLGRGLGCVERGGETWKRCVERAREMSRGLEEQGVGFGGLVGRGVEGVEEFLRGLEEGDGGGVVDRGSGSGGARASTSARASSRGNGRLTEELEAAQRGSVSRRGAVTG